MEKMIIVPANIPTTEPNLIKEKGEVNTITGLRWGDEGKAKIVLVIMQLLGIKYGVRYQGGPNAGHTVYVDINNKTEKIIFRQIPSCAVQKNGIPCIAKGMVINPKFLIEEICRLQNFGFITNIGIPIIDHKTHIIMPWHIALDDLSGKVGSTKNGIGPAYSDKYTRIGIRMTDLLHAGTLQEKVKEALEYHKNLKMDVNKITDEYLEYGKTLKLNIKDVGKFLWNALNNGNDILGEAQGGYYIGVENDDYPFCTSSDTTPAGFFTGTGISPRFLGDSWGILKAYDTRVGNGPFITKLEDTIGELLRKKGGEFGAATGRPRDCGWLDALSTKNAIQKSDITKIILNKLDVLSGFPEIQICIGYERDGKIIFDMEEDLTERSMMNPVYKTFNGWSENIKGKQKLEDLPKNSRVFIDYLEKYFEAPIAGIGTSPKAEDMIML